MGGVIPVGDGMPMSGIMPDNTMHNGMMRGAPGVAVSSLDTHDSGGEAFVSPRRQRGDGGETSHLLSNRLLKEDGARPTARSEAEEDRAGRFAGCTLEAVFEARLQERAAG